LLGVGVDPNPPNCPDDPNVFEAADPNAGVEEGADPNEEGADPKS